MRLLVTLAMIGASASAQFAPTGRSPVERPLSPIAVDGRMPGPGPGREVGDIRARIDRGRDGGALTRREARKYDREARQIGVLAKRYGQDGLSAAEARELDMRARVLRELVEARRVRTPAKK